jgi:hypothetical protein
MTRRLGAMMKLLAWTSQNEESTKASLVPQKCRIQGIDRLVPTPSAEPAAAAYE